jgi:hypothetical protein
MKYRMRAGWDRMIAKSAVWLMCRGLMSLFSLYVSGYLVRR